MGYKAKKNVQIEKKLHKNNARMLFENCKQN